MIRTIVGDITKLTNVDYICNAANGRGRPMGSGVAGAIRRAGGKSIEDDAYRTCLESNPKEGELYTSTAGTLPYVEVIHLVTMKNPGSRCFEWVVRKCLDSLINYCRQHDISKVALPALGTGVGGLNVELVANIYKEILSPIEDIEFVVTDIDSKFINYFYNREDVHR